MEAITIENRAQKQQNQLLKFYQDILHLIVLQNSNLCFEVETDYQLVIVELRTLLIEHEPPGGGADCRAADVASYRHVAEEQPAADQWLFGVARRFVHDV